MSRAIIQTLAVRIVQAYKLIISPWLPSACRFTPTCSEYAAEAIVQYGVLTGVIRAIGRLLRCHPLHRGGFDPVK
jgi:putative membrane protein insertion efficiency factor